MSWLCKVTLASSRFRSTVPWAALVVSLTLLGGSPAGASKKMRPLTQAEVSQAWVGISEDELYIFRISLSAEGGGGGAYAFADSDPRPFRISSWKYKPPSILITMEPVDRSPLVADRLVGEISGIRMNLVMSGKGWSRSLTFRREDVLLRRWSRIKEAMPRPASAQAGADNDRNW